MAGDGVWGLRTRHRGVPIGVDENSLLGRRWGRHLLLGREVRIQFAGIARRHRRHPQGRGCRLGACRKPHADIAVIAAKVPPMPPYHSCPPGECGPPAAPARPAARRKGQHTGSGPLDVNLSLYAGLVNIPARLYTVAQAGGGLEHGPLPPPPSLLPAQSLELHREDDERSVAAAGVTCCGETVSQPSAGTAGALMHAAPLLRIIGEPLDQLEVDPAGATAPVAGDYRAPPYGDCRHGASLRPRGKSRHVVFSVTDRAQVAVRLT